MLKTPASGVLTSKASST